VGSRPDDHVDDDWRQLADDLLGPSTMHLATGNAPGLAPVFDRVRVTVATLRFGAGIKSTVLESFAADVPGVMTSVAAEGLPLTPNVRRLVADNPEQIAELTCLLHADSGANAEAARAGLSMLANNFTADHVRRLLLSASRRAGGPADASA
jgi:O-antigen biosynthesis protein